MGSETVLAVISRHRGRRIDERGALTPAVIVMAVGLMLLGGLVTDGGRQLNARLRAQATAEEAARAGANMLDLRESEAVIDPQKAEEAVTSYCRVAIAEDPTITTCEFFDVGHDDNKETDFVEVDVEITIKPLLFGLIGVSDLHASASASASAVQAVTDPYHDRAFPEISPTPEIPTTKIDLTTNTDVPDPTTILPPVEYTTQLCGQQTSLPLTVGVSCSQTTVTLPTAPPPPPPPPSPTLTTIETTYSTFPTTVDPGF